MKRCSKCKTLKPISEFGKNRWHKTGIHHECRECARANGRKYKSQNTDKRRQRMKSMAAKKRDWLNEYKSTQSCKLCGERHIACLEFHHIDDSTKRFSVGTNFNSHNKQEVIQEISKCIILCSNCHKKTHYEQRHPGLTVNDPATTEHLAAPYQIAMH